jgi:two-component system, chemotaxis family, protein-glutamate methylesterase/glutaminase
LIRVLVVDDSRVIRKIVTRILEKDPAVRVIDTAADGREALEKIETHRPDVVTLDLEMPVMDGIETLKRIMATNPLPVIILSALTKDGANITMEALNMGACDFFTKDFSNSGSLPEKELLLVRKVKNVARKKVEVLLRRCGNTERRLPSVPVISSKREVVSVGASTGGPPALQHILSNLPKDFPIPVVIAQHMPRVFTQSFAERLNAMSKMTVKEAENGEPLKPGVALIAPGDSHLALRRRGREVSVELVNDGKYIYRPSVDLLMSTTAAAYESRAGGVILTGMGSDGVVGMREMKSRGGYIIAQDEETCVVYGMPKAVVNANIADAVLPIDRIPEEIIRIL